MPSTSHKTLKRKRVRTKQVFDCLLFNFSRTVWSAVFKEPLDEKASNFCELLSLILEVCLFLSGNGLGLSRNT